MDFGCSRLISVLNHRLDGHLLPDLAAVGTMSSQTEVSIAIPI